MKNRWLSSYNRALRYARLTILSTLMTAVLLFSPVLWAQLTSSQTETTLDVVFDIDWTLVNSTTEKMAAADSKGIIKIDRTFYRLSDHALEVLMALHKTPGVRVSFFSGGSTERNQKLLQIVYERLNKEAHPSQFQPHLILSVDHIKQVSQSPDLKFSERLKKDLSPYFDLKRVLLFDDVKDFFYPGQEKNLIWVGKTYNDRVRFDLAHLESQSEKDKPYSAPNYNEWNRDRNRLLRVLDIVQESLRISREKNISVVEAAQYFLRLENTVSCKSKIKSAM